MKVFEWFLFENRWKWYVRVRVDFTYKKAWINMSLSEQIARQRKRDSSKVHFNHNSISFHWSRSIATVSIKPTKIYNRACVYKQNRQMRSFSAAADAETTIVIKIEKKGGRRKWEIKQNGFRTTMAPTMPPRVYYRNSREKLLALLLWFVVVRTIKKRTVPLFAYSWAKREWNIAEGNKSTRNPENI